jgi:hypothetical protein
MAYFPGTFVEKGTASCDRMNYLIDDLLTPRVLPFRMICFYDLPMRLCPDGETWKAPYGNWLEGSDCYEVNKNGCPLLLSDMVDFDPLMGSFKLAGGTELGPDNRPRDVVEATFQFDYFPVELMEAYLKQALQNINAGAFGPPTCYGICSNPPPSYWDGVIVDMAFAHMMEKILLDYNLWKYKLIFAIGPNEVEGGGGDIVGQIETLKQNAETRAGRAMDNEKFKIGGNYTSPPTQFYFQSIRGIGGMGGGGGQGVPVGGRLRGWHRNRY